METNNKKLDIINDVFNDNININVLNTNIKADVLKINILNNLAMLEDDNKIVESYLIISKIKKVLNDLSDNDIYKDLTRKSLNNIIAKQSEDKLTINGVVLSTGAVYTKYNYSACEHPVFNFLTKIEVKFRALRKEIETELQLIPKVKQEIINDFETGEIKTVNTGGSKTIFINPDDIINKLNYVITEAEDLIQNINDNKGLFTVLIPEKLQAYGIKITNL